MNKRYSFYFESERCIKCWSCEIACKQWYGIKAGSVSYRKVKEVTTGNFPEVSRKFLSLSCKHCAKAPCVAICPTKALQQRSEDGIVVVDKEKCIGCRSCLEACPFGVPEYDEDGTLRKCDMCVDRIEKNQIPFCVANCPTMALHWGTGEDMTRLATEKAIRKMQG